MKVCQACLRLARNMRLDGLGQHSETLPDPGYCENCGTLAKLNEVEYISPYWHGRMPFVPMQ